MLHSVFPRAKDIIYRTIVHIPFVLIMVVIFSLPTIVSFGARDSFVGIKMLILSTCVILALFFWLLRAFITREIHIQRSLFDLPVCIFLVGVGLSTAFSLSPHVSFFGGVGQGFTSFHTWFFPILLFWLILQECTNKKRWFMLVAACIAGGILSAVAYLMLSSSVFYGFVLVHLGITLPEGFTNLMTNSTSVFSAYMAVSLILSVGVLLARSTPLYIYRMACLGVLATGMVLLSLGSSFVFRSSIIGLFLVLGITVALRGQVSRSRGVALGVLTILVLCLGVFGYSNAVKHRSPSEVTLHPATSSYIAQESLLSGVKYFLVGSGPGTFSYRFSLFRFPEFNSGQFYFLTEQVQSYSAVHTMLVELGFVITMVFALLPLLFIGVFVSIVFGVYIQTKNNRRTQGIQHFFSLEGIFMGAGFVLFSSTFLFFNVGVGVLGMWWIFFALAIVGLSFLAPRIRTSKHIVLSLTPEYELSCVVALACAIMGGIILFAFQVRFYQAEIYFTKLNKTTNPVAQDMYIKEILERGSSVAAYHHTFADLYLQRASFESGRPMPQAQVIKKYLTLAGNAAKKATEIDPERAQYWELLGKVYAQTVYFVPGAEEWSVRAYKKVLEKEPVNPYAHFYLGYIAEEDGQHAMARSFYEKAITLKPDYMIAYVRLAHMLEVTHDLDKAILVQEQAVALNSNHVEVLYEYGRMLFNRGLPQDVLLAKEVWSVAGDIDPNHANTLFSLGALYEREGEAHIALSYYKRVAGLNPENKEIHKKISALTY
ncbi:MAG: tetratricopeptide repeat protein [Candidatus Magasanikbacteria bacterium]|nr:tetratricopeptide repeat protein [Candidatus Magasanikbacteria bacterium]MBT6294508.1 tetratricopeptide repeat protein [Candidatus Magasanikbacteria bacterium]